MKFQMKQSETTNKCRQTEKRMRFRQGRNRFAKWDGEDIPDFEHMTRKFIDYFFSFRYHPNTRLDLYKLPCIIFNLQDRITSLSNVTNKLEDKVKTRYALGKSWWFSEQLNVKNWNLINMKILLQKFREKI